MGTDKLPDYFPLQVGNWWLYSVEEYQQGGGPIGATGILYKRDSVAITDTEKGIDTTVYSAVTTTYYDSLVTVIWTGNQTTIFKDSMTTAIAYIKESGNSLVYEAVQDTTNNDYPLPPFCYFYHNLNIGDLIADCYDSSTVSEGDSFLVKKNQIRTITLSPRIVFNYEQRNYADGYGLVYQTVSSFIVPSSQAPAAPPSTGATVRMLKDYYIIDPVKIDNRSLSKLSSQPILLTVSPSPFRDRTVIQTGRNVGLNLEEGVVEVYNVQGERVKFWQGMLGDQFVWNAQNMQGGIYFIKLHANHQTLVQKTILLK